VREELRSLPNDLAELVGRHLIAAERALEQDDPDKAYEHTKAARRFAARIGVVREAAGIVAYRAGHFSEALSDLRAARRMTGSDAYLPIMADCERGMGRPERALDLVRSPEAERLDRAGRIELSIVESGARRDLGQNDAAVITLQRLPELRDPQPKPWSARLAFAYADALAEAGHEEAATDWFARAMAFDEDGETEAAERYAELTGAVIEDVEEDFDDDSDTVPEEGDLLEGSAAEESDDLVDEYPEEAEPEIDQAGPDISEPSEVTEVAADDLADAAALAGPEGGDKVPVSSEDADRGDILDDPRDEDVQDDAGDVEPDDVQDPRDAERDDVQDGPEDAESGDLLDDPEDAEPDDVSDGSAAAESGDSKSDVSPVERPEKIMELGVPSITPAFIEPDFGDILDQPDEDPQDTSKRDK
jgi:tetratricopeptide (TPR) repeat protein